MCHYRQLHTIDAEIFLPVVHEASVIVGNVEVSCVSIFKVAFFARLDVVKVDVDVIVPIGARLLVVKS